MQARMWMRLRGGSSNMSGLCSLVVSLPDNQGLDCNNEEELKMTPAMRLMSMRLGGCRSGCG
jgi:hypothetical protein